MKCKTQLLRGKFDENKLHIFHLSIKAHTFSWYQQILIVNCMSSKNNLCFWQRIVPIKFRWKYLEKVAIWQFFKDENKCLASIVWNTLKRWCCINLEKVMYFFRLVTIHYIYIKGIVTSFLIFRFNEHTSSRSPCYILHHLKHFSRSLLSNFFNIIHPSSYAK